MKYLTVAQAAQRTGLSERAIYDRIGDHTLTATGIKLRIPEDSLDRFILDRQQAAAAKVGDLTRFAEQVRKRLQWPGGTKGTVLQRDKDALKIFGPHILQAAGMPENRGCRWCWARMTAAVHGGLQPTLTVPHRQLLGEPCREDLKVLREQLRARHPSPQPTEPEPVQARTAAPRGYKACGIAVGVACECHTSDRPGGPRRNDGSDLAATRRKALTAAIKAAQDRGDHKHAQQLRGLLTSLTAQAVRTPKKSAGTTGRRPDIHGCGCACPEHRSQP
ncbi:helix-turn-helix domain-containing protein [Streptomyces sp. B21-105]|uniref:helix-turn-helix domain-containing protein n=1 Tax=Streptomyces sp. B21-105 TaxID=3039417 RepID=UPI002FF0263B